MQVSPPELRELRYFVAVAEELSFAVAAKRLYVTPQALSRSIMVLERSLGVRLFERSSRVVVLTDVGQAYLEEAQQLLARAEQMSTRIRTLVDGTSSTLRLSYFANAAPADALLAAFRMANPGIKVIKVAADHVTGTQEDVVSGRADVGVTWWPLFDESLRGVVLSVQRLGVVLCEEHPLARHTVLTPAMVANFPVASTWSTLSPEATRAWLGGVRPYGRSAGDPDCRTVEEGLEAVVGTEAIIILPIESGISLYRRPGVTHRDYDAEPFRAGLAWRHDDARASLAALTTFARSLAPVPEQ